MVWNPGEITALLRLSEGDLPRGRAGQVQTFDFISIYAEGCVKNSTGNRPDPAAQGLKILVDAGNGAGGFYAEKVLQPLGADIQGSQFLEPDGHFSTSYSQSRKCRGHAKPCRRCDPAQCRFWFDFDTDVDRVGAVDKGGVVLNKNRLIAVISAVFAP